jgi:hypothetical protein
MENTTKIPTEAEAMEAIKNFFVEWVLGELGIKKP